MGDERDDTWHDEEDLDPTTENIRIIGDDTSEPVLRFGNESSRPHWSEPPTGEVPRLFAEEEPDDAEAWSSLPDQPPVWRDDRTSFSNVDFDDLGRFGESHALSADDPTDAVDAPSGENAFLASLSEPEPARVTSIRTRGAERAASSARRGDATFTPTRGTGGRDMPVAFGVGVGLVAVLFVLAKAGPGYLVGLATVVLVAAVAEFYNAMRTVGYRPATLVGLVATAGLPLAIYWHGLATVPIVLGLAVVTTLVWFLFVDQDSRPLPNLCVTLAGVLYIGGLGGFAAALLNLNSGVGALLGTVICTVAFDIAGLFIGSSAGRTQLSPKVSPNKTWEGLAGATVGTIIVGLLLVKLFGGLSPWDKWQHGFQLGLVVAVMAALGDLAESMIKRDLGVKDMGTLLPGHGGVLDRIDALLFTLPAAYLLCQVLRIGVF